MDGSGGHHVKNILLTGRPGGGKTTALMAAVKLLGGSPGGFYTAEFREKGERTGFEVTGENRGDIPALLKACLEKLLYAR